MGQVVSMVGDKFGWLEVVDRAGSTIDGKAAWECVCKCGTRKVVGRGSLLSGRVKSCGCWKSKHPGPKTTHGLSHTPQYKAWKTMIARCYRPTFDRYPYYGARGIGVCSRWRESYVAFLTDMGPRPSGHTVERRDNNGDYTPDNCYWATYREQALNRRPKGSVYEQV